MVVIYTFKATEVGIVILKLYLSPGPWRKKRFARAIKLTNNAADK